MADPKVHYFVHKICTPQWRLQDHRLGYWDLTFVLGGEAVYESDGSTYCLKAGQAVSLSKNAGRTARTEGMECVAFSYQLEGALPWPDGVVQWDRDQLLLHYFGEFERKWYTLDPDKELFCKGIFLLILYRLTELYRQSHTNCHVLEMRRYLEEHYREPVTVASVAAHMGLHPTYCGAIFRQETGRTILQTVNLMRINRAAELLRHGGMKVSEAAAACGYSDLYYFSRVFKKLMGYSPEQFIRESIGDAQA